LSLYTFLRKVSPLCVYFKKYINAKGTVYEMKENVQLSDVAERTVQLYIYPGKDGSMFMDLSTSNHNCKVRHSIQQTSSVSMSLDASLRKTISDLLSEIPRVRCEVFNEHYSILVDDEDKTHILFSHLFGAFRETRTNAFYNSNRKLPQYESIRTMLAKLNYDITEFDS